VYAREGLTDHETVRRLDEADQIERRPFLRATRDECTPCRNAMVSCNVSHRTHTMRRKCCEQGNVAQLPQACTQIRELLCLK